MIRIQEIVRAGKAVFANIKGDPADANKFLRLDGSAVHLGAQGELFRLEVTGTLDPDVTGNYSYAGEFEGVASYKKDVQVGGYDYYISYPPGGSTYFLSRFGPGNSVYPVTSIKWESDTGGLAGTYSPTGVSTATGTATVALVSIAAEDSALAVTAKNEAVAAKDLAETAKNEAETAAATVLPRRMTAAFVSAPKTLTETPSALFAGASVLAARTWMFVRNESTDTRLRFGRLQANLQRDGAIVEPQAAIFLPFAPGEATTIYGVSEGRAITVSTAEDAE